MRRMDSDEIVDVAGPGGLEAKRTSPQYMLQATGEIRLVQLRKSTAGVSTSADIMNSRVERSTPLFFSREEFAMVDELTELIIPADDHSPGARAAEVAGYIDRRLAESFDEEPKETWRRGLKLIDSMSIEMHGRRFMQATPGQRTRVLVRISENELKPQKPEEHFFNELKSRTVRAYYTSKIGIHDEMEYKGNAYLEEFIGYDAK